MAIIWPFSDVCTANPMLIPVDSEKTGSRISFENPRNALITTFRFIDFLFKKVCEHYIFIEIPISDHSPTIITDQLSKSELLDCIPETTAALKEILYLLVSTQNYVKYPCDETAKPLRLLFDCEKSAYNELFTPETIENFFDFSRTLLTNIRSQDDKEGEKSQNCEIDQGSSNSEDRNLDEDINLHSQPNSISGEDSECDVGNATSTSLPPNFESKNISGDKKRSNVAQNDLHSNPGKALKKSEEKLSENFVISNEESCSVQQRNMNKCHQKPKSKIFKDIGGIDDVFPQVKKGNQGIHRRVKYSGTEKKRKSEKMSEEFPLKPTNSAQFLTPSYMAMSQREKELEDENGFLRKQLESLQSKYEETLAELGKIVVEKTAKENQQRKSDFFQQIFHPPIREVEISPLSKPKDKPINDTSSPIVYPTGSRSGYENCCRANGPVNSSHRPQTSNNESASRPPLNTSVFSPADSSEQPIRGAEGLAQGSNKGERVTNDRSRIKDSFKQVTEKVTDEVQGHRENRTLTTQNSPCVQSREMATCGERANQSGETNGTNDLASTSTCRPGYENLSFSVQQDDSGSESISLGNVPPTSVATTLYNNYKLLLLSLAQNLLSSDVVKLKDWAAQTFSINNPQNNSIDILFQLDQKGVINASDLSQLSDFFESIIRFDLVHIIDAFLLGDYSLLRQNQASRSKNQGANPAQNLPQRARNVDFLNAVNTRQFPISAARNPTASRRPESNNGSQVSHPQYTQQAAIRNSSGTTNPTHFPRAPDENQTMGSWQQNPKAAATLPSPCRMTDAAVADNGLVTSKCIFHIFNR